jgi:peptide/nickel transport system permease protein
MQLSAGTTQTPATQSYWGLVFRAFIQNRLAVLGLLILVFMTLFSFVGPMIYRVSPYATHLLSALQGPSAAHPLGTDGLGRDELARLMYGGQSSLIIGFVSAVISMVIGVAYGAISGYIGGWVDVWLMRIVDVLLAIPVLLLLILLVTMFKPSSALLIWVLGLTSWPGIARLIRGEVLTLKERDFVTAERALGASNTRTLVYHILPNAIGTIMVTAAFQIGNAILVLAGLSFLGLGVPPPTPNWGGMLSNATSDYIYQNLWWLIYPPGIAILVTVISFFLLGNALRDAFDMRLQKKGNGQKRT